MHVIIPFAILEEPIFGIHCHQQYMTEEIKSCSQLKNDIYVDTWYVHAHIRMYMYIHFIRDRSSDLYVGMEVVEMF